MKLQYLGDSKDSFKWDYHDYLVKELGFSIFNIVLIMTPDDDSNDGKSHPTLFPARKAIIEYCEELRSERSIESIKKLTDKTNSNYEIILHKANSNITKRNRKEHFTGFVEKPNQLLLLDPDNGFEPERSCNEKHVKYSEIDLILHQITEDSVVSVFQHFRRIPFIDDLARIRERLINGYSTAIYWNYLMFVSISKSYDIIEKVIKANKKYQKNHPVEIIV